MTASGMAAISAGLMCQLQPGDHIMVQEGLYGGTFTFLTEDLKRWRGGEWSSISWMAALPIPGRQS